MYIDVVLKYLSANQSESTTCINYYFTFLVSSRGVCNTWSKLEELCFYSKSFLYLLIIIYHIIFTIKLQLYRTLKYSIDFVLPFFRKIISYHLNEIGKLGRFKFQYLLILICHWKYVTYSKHTLNIKWLNVFCNLILCPCYDINTNHARYIRDNTKQGWCKKTPHYFRRVKNLILNYHKNVKFVQSVFFSLRMIFKEKQLCLFVRL